jgi:hypothetical protein
MKSLALGAALLCVLTLNACRTGVEPGSTTLLTFASGPGSGGSSDGGSPAAGGGSGAGTPGDTIRSGDDVLVMDQVEIVFRRIELTSIESGSCDSVSGSGSCLEFRTDPMVVDVPLGGGPLVSVSADIPAGTYRRIEFSIHKLDDDDPRHADLAAQRPDLLDRSVLVRGSFNGTPFTYESDLNEDQRVEVSPPLVVTGDTPANLTVRIDIAKWFVDESGSLVDPASADKGGSHENLVRDNIRDSFRAFEDGDRDGDGGTG